MVKSIGSLKRGGNDTLIDWCSIVLTLQKDILECAG